mmetsp:Transcript_1380/g.3563  ORF Transcript_1380/g.3563 Transcript_1380/m.3563 type:complete len:211 (+) Transcript_1380:398-1030(+)
MRRSCTKAALAISRVSRSPGSACARAAPPKQSVGGGSAAAKREGSKRSGSAWEEGREAATKGSGAISAPAGSVRPPKRVGWERRKRCGRAGGAVRRTSQVNASRNGISPSSAAVIGARGADPLSTAACSLASCALAAGCACAAAIILHSSAAVCSTLAVSSSTASSAATPRRAAHGASASRSAAVPSCRSSRLPSARTPPSSRRASACDW